MDHIPDGRNKRQETKLNEPPVETKKKKKVEWATVLGQERLAEYTILY